MKSAPLAALAALLTSCAAASGARVSPSLAPPSDAGVRALSIHAGTRSFDEDDWAPVEDQLAFALDYAAQSAGAAVGFEVGASYSADEDDIFVPGFGEFDAEATFVELYAGVHKSFETGQGVRPSLGAGLTLVSAEVEVAQGGSSASEDDETLGFYLHGGVGFPIGERIEIGADLRAVLGAELDIAGVDADADYLQATAFLAFRF